MIDRFYVVIPVIIGSDVGPLPNAFLPDTVTVIFDEEGHDELEKFKLCSQ